MFILFLVYLCVACFGALSEATRIARPLMSGTNESLSDPSTSYECHVNEHRVNISAYGDPILPFKDVQRFVSDKVLLHIEQLDPGSSRLDWMDKDRSDTGLVFAVYGTDDKPIYPSMIYSAAECVDNYLLDYEEGTMMKPIRFIVLAKDKDTQYAFGRLGKIHPYEDQQR